MPASPTPAQDQAMPATHIPAQDQVMPATRTTPIPE